MKQEKLHRIVRTERPAGLKGFLFGRRERIIVEGGHQEILKRDRFL